MMPLIPWLKPRQTLARKQQQRNNKKHSRSMRFAVLLSTGIFVLANLFFLMHMLGNEDADDPMAIVGGRKGLHARGSSTGGKLSAGTTSACQFRRYPPHRYYKLQEQAQPDFLVGDSSEVEYVYGKWPLLLHAHGSQRKLCVDQTEWLPPPASSLNELPFADGTNPSILSVEHIQQKQQQHSNNADWLSQYPTAAFVATACMTNSQCQWKDSEAEINKHGLSRQEKPATVRTVLLVLNADFTTLAQATLYLERDADWGRRVKAANDTTGTGQPAKVIKAFDDARLFLHKGDIWVSYREGMGFGWDNQVLNPIHFEATSAVPAASSPAPVATLTATLKASETEQFCCGRNMALMENLQQPEQLQSLTWVDPVTVIDVEFVHKQDTARRRRRLARKKKKPEKRKSHIHGTNAFMLYLEDRNEFLGMGHFHRPKDRETNDYARFGHHYTHTLFTVSAQAPFELKTLSQEFVLESVHDAKDAEIIQFASGLERSGDNLVIAYGVNDCEAGVMQISLKVLDELLIPVEAGKQVLDYMLPLSRP